MARFAGAADVTRIVSSIVKDHSQGGDDGDKDGDDPAQGR
jgi:hypothetical protein